MTHKKHFPMLDGLRGICAIVVLVHHTLLPFDLGWLLPHAHTIVDFFFCLSGFIVGYAYERRLLSGLAFKEFVIIRMIRLYPLLAVGVLFGALIYMLKAATLGPTLDSNFIAVLGLQLILMPNPLVLSEGWASIMPLNPPSWSLFFILVANFIFAASITWLTKPVMKVLLIVGATIVLTQAYVHDAVVGGNYWSTFSAGFGRVLFPFLCGVSLYRFWTVYNLERPVKLAPLVPLILIIFLICPIPPSLIWLYESFLVLIIFNLLISLGTQCELLPRTASFYMFLGNLSYPLYILHYPLIHVFSHFAIAHGLHGIALWLLIAVEMLSAFVLAFIVMRWVDEPVRAWLEGTWERRRLALCMHETAVNRKGGRADVTGPSGQMPRRNDEPGCNALSGFGMGSEGRSPQQLWNGQ